MEHEEETPPVEEGPAPRRYPSTLGGALYLLMMLAVLVSVAVVVLSSWRVGVRLFGGSLVVGAVMRLALPDPEAGRFAVRSKAVDAFLYVLVGGALIVLASSIPDQPV